MIKLYDTLTRKKEELPPPSREASADAKALADKTGGTAATKGKLRIFVCGPTTYDYPHIGNARTFMIFDIIVRYLRSRGVEIFYLQNITDIDDKVIVRAAQENADWKTVSRRFEKIYLNDMKKLGITSVNKYARATDYIPQIVSQVKRLVEKGNAYLIENDGYYFDLKTFPDYGKLAGRTVEQAEDATSRIDTSDKKRNKGDFALWKFSGPNEPGWKTELGFGRPGWHIEDTAISEHFFGPQYELHGGALDLKFPHHEAEIAQAESISGKKPFVQIWMHAGFLFVNGKKMSKSLGNFITIDEFVGHNSAELFRWMVLNHHYRSPIDYTAELLAQSKSSLGKLHQFVEKIKIVGKNQRRSFGSTDPDLRRDDKAVDMHKRLSAAQAEFQNAMDDDVNTPGAVASLFSLALEFQTKLWQLAPEDAKMLALYIESTLESLGISLKSPKIPKEIKALVKKREAARSNQQFMQSDDLRKEADSLGFIVEDTPMGPFVWPK